MNISQNTALFSLLGVTFGGNGSQTFGIPNMAGRVVVGAEAAYPLGTTGGAASVTLNQLQLPAHTHGATFTSTTQDANVSLTVSGPFNADVTVSGALSATTGAAQDNDPKSGWTLGAVNGTTKVYAPTTAGTAVPLATINSTGSVSGNLNVPVTGTVSVPVSGTISVGPSGTSAPVPTMPPYIVLNNVIAMSGIFPSRS